jgi:hypothetical protein
MTRRRLRLPAAIALLAIAAPVLATARHDTVTGARIASLHSHARHFGVAVKHSSRHFGRRVAGDARRAGRQLHAHLHRVGHGFHHRSEHARSGLARA